MGHLVAYSGNDPELLACALFQARPGLFWETEAEAEGWGFGFVQGEEVLLQKSPRADSRQVDFYALARDLRADALVGRVGLSNPGAGTAENADPFRFRSWLFATIDDGSLNTRAGELGGFETIRERLLQSIPDFLRRNIRGRSASEHVFHLFLAFLHDAGLLESGAPPLSEVQHALHQSVLFIERLGAPHVGMALVACNDRCLVAESRGIPVQFLEIPAIADCSCPACPVRRRYPERTQPIAHDQLRAVVLEAHGALLARAGWNGVADGHSLLIGADRTPAILTNV